MSTKITEATPSPKKNEPKSKPASQVRYNDKIAARVCEQIASRPVSLCEICRDPDMPALCTVFRWLREHPEFREELAEGIGVAIAFTHLATPSVIAASVQRFGPRLHTALMRGVGLCLYEMTVEDPRVTPQIDAITDPRLRSAYELCERAAAEVPVGPRWYWRYAAFLRECSEPVAAGAESVA